jgi:hypothetical protein
MTLLASERVSSGRDDIGNILPGGRVRRGEQEALAARVDDGSLIAMSSHQRWQCTR